MRKHVLIIDDNIGLCDGLVEILRDAGYLVDCASESARGLEYIYANHYDVCILDYTMKGMNGIDLLKIIKRNDPQCVVGIISGRTDIEILIHEERVAGLVAHVFTKPFDIEILLHKVRSSIRTGLPP
jgi:DNA-binding NtrC family response regulator